MKNYEIFISYRRDGGDALAGRISDRLTALGYTVFYDVESMRSGKFNKQIYDAIDKCKDVIVVLPPNGLDRCSNPDDWVRKELVYAIKNNKTVIPVMMRGFEWPENLPDDLKELPDMEGVPASSDYFDAVIDKILRLCDSSALKNTNWDKMKDDPQGPSLIYNVCSKCSCDFDNAFPKDGHYSQIIDRDEYNVIYFHLTTAEMDKAKITSRFMIFDEDDNVVHEDDSEFDWGKEYNKLSLSWVIKGSDGSFVKSGTYRAVFSIDNSRLYEYKFVVKSSSDPFPEDQKHEKSMISQQVGKKVRKLSKIHIALLLAIIVEIILATQNDNVVVFMALSMIVYFILGIVILIKVLRDKTQTGTAKIILLLSFFVGYSVMLGLCGLLIYKKQGNTGKNKEK